MFESQALEAAIGLALLFFVIASGASAFVEVLSTLLRKRAVDLEKALTMLVAGKGVDVGAVLTDQEKATMALFQGTSVYQAAAGAVKAGKSAAVKGRAAAGPSYLAARSFADAVAELMHTVPEEDLSQFSETNLGRRLQAMKKEGVTTLTAQKAGLESWFDESMARLGGAYKRWANGVLFVVGLLIAVAGNFSALNVADQLWRDPVARQVLANSASVVSARDKDDYTGLAQQVDKVGSLGLPGGWHGLVGWNWQTWVVHAVGWLITALLVMLGAPFWFEALSRLVSLRAAGSKPAAAPDDDSSASARMIRAEDNSSRTAVTAEPSMPVPPVPTPPDQPTPATV